MGCIQSARYGESDMGFYFRHLGYTDNLSRIQKLQRTSAYQITKQGVPLLFASALATSIDKRIQETRQVNMSSFSNHFDDYLQYAPMAAMFGIIAVR